MARLSLEQRVETAVKYLQANCGVRYWEDGTVNGVEDEDGSRIPCRVGDSWRPMIDLDDGRIMNWPEGVTASVHYKVCDDGRYAIFDSAMNELRTIEGYVPKMLSPSGDGFGDYVIMTIGPDGTIEGWRTDLSPFEDE